MGMPLTNRRFTVDEYYRMADTGILTEDDRVELLDGEIVKLSPIGPRHAATVTDLQYALHRVTGSRAVVRVQNPVRLDQYNEPEPDIVLVRPRPGGYRIRHPGPGEAILVIEVADTSTEYDHTVKLPLYADAGIPEVWLVDLANEQIEIYRDPLERSYPRPRIVTREETLTIAALPDIAITAAEVLG